MLGHHGRAPKYRVWLAAAGLGAGLLTAGTAPAAADPGAAGHGAIHQAADHGVAPGGGLQFLPAAERDRTLDDMVRLGVGRLRLDLNWADVQESGPNSYDWTRYDKLIAAATARHLRPLAIVDYTPSWARPADCVDDDKCAPARISDYLNFVTRAARRYAPRGVHDWEIWNEPNNVNFWKPAPDPDRYALMLIGASRALRSVDRHAFVLTGGTAPEADDGTNINGVTWLEELYDNGAGDSFDAANTHPYCFPYLAPGEYADWCAWSQMADTPKSMRSVMIAHGDAGKKIWMTEYGAHTQGDGSVSEQTQADWVSRAYAEIRNQPWAGPLFYYNLQDGDGTDPYDTFGLRRADWSRKPAWQAYQDSARQRHRGPNGSGGTTTSRISDPINRSEPAQPAGTVTPAIASTSAGTPGIAPGGGLQYLSSADLTRTLDGMKNVGVKWVRVDLNWSDIQGGGSNSYSWSRYDTTISGITSRGMTPLPIIDYTPAWARPSTCTASDKCAPASPVTYASFVTAAVNRYKTQGVKYWEIWNEPNNVNFWQPKPNVAAYTALLKKAYTAAKQADSTAFVVIGGTAPETDDGTNINGVTFLSGVYSNGGKAYFDAANTHPYCYPAGPTETFTWSAWSQMADTTPSLRSVMTSNGDSAKKIWMTEFGAPTKGSAANSEAAQAQWVDNAFTTARSYSWAGPLFVYNYRDTPGDDEDSFGLLRSDWSQKPSWQAYYDAAH